MDDLTRAALFLELTQAQRELDSEALIKASSGGENLTTGKLDFQEIYQKLSRKREQNIAHSELKKTIREETKIVPVEDSPQKASIRLSQSYLANSLAVKFLNNHYQRKRAVIDSFRPN